MRTLPIVASVIAIGLAACTPSHHGGYYDPDYDDSRHGGPAIVEDAHVNSYDEAVTIADTRGRHFDEVQIVNDGQRHGYNDGMSHGYPDSYFGQRRSPPRYRYTTRHPLDEYRGRGANYGHGQATSSGPYGPGLNHHAPVPSPNSEDVGIGPAQVAEVQSTLRQLGFNPGRTDGVYGPQTGRAIVDYTTHQGMPTDGAITHSLMSYLRSDLSARIRAQSRTSGGQHHY